LIKNEIGTYLTTTKGVMGQAERSSFRALGEKVKLFLAQKGTVEDAGGEERTKSEELPQPQVMLFSLRYARGQD
jgi:hypothetical protein